MSVKRQMSERSRSNVSERNSCPSYFAVSSIFWVTVTRLQRSQKFLRGEKQ